MLLTVLHLSNTLWATILFTLHEKATTKKLYDVLWEAPFSQKICVISQSIFLLQFMNFFSDIGNYFLLLKDVFKRPQNRHLYKDQVFSEMVSIGIGSLPIVAVVSIFMGAAVVIQLAANLDNPIYPLWVNGFASRKTIVLEFSPTIISLILAGKVGSRITSEIGSMRISEQIDALDVMGVSSASYLILPKMIACLLFNPAIITLSIFLALFGGGVAGHLSGLITMTNFLMGLRLEFQAYEIFYAIIKGVVFAFIITSVSGYRGYTVKGGALEVGKASTRAVVESSVILIITNLVLTQLLL